MLLVDTSVWIEFLRAKVPVMPILMSEMRYRRVLALECVFGELLQGARTAHERNTIQQYWEHLPKIDESGAWLAAGLASGQHKWIDKGIGLIDAVILTAARRERAQVWSLDKKLNALLAPAERFTPHS